jgi:CRISPR system Cascade subunit CasA
MLFDHTVDDPPPGFTAAQAARVVITAQTYALGGGQADRGNLSGPPGNLTHAPLAAGATVLVRGDTLFETLWLNLTIFDSDSKPVAGDGNDSPVWEREPNEPHQEPAIPRGYLDYLTWQSRTLRLNPEEEEGRLIVRRVSVTQGRKFVSPARFYDPMIAYSRSEKDGDRPIRLQESRDLWRDSATLFQFGETDQFRGPTTLHTLAAAEIGNALPRSSRYRLSLIGLCADQAKVYFWRHESLPLPLAYLDRPELVETLKDALGLTENVAKVALRPAAWVAASSRLTSSAGMSPDKGRVSSLLDSFAAERLYWSQLERPFRELIVALAAPGADLSACVHAWFWDTLRDAAEGAFDESIGRIDGGRDLKAVSAGRGVLFSRLKKLQTDNRIPNRERNGAA